MSSKSIWHVCESISLGGCESIMMTTDECDNELDDRTNRCMKQLYGEGYRRFRVVPLSRNGYAIRRLVLGWPA